MSGCPSSAAAIVAAIASSAVRASIITAAARFSHCRRRAASTRSVVSVTAQKIPSGRSATLMIGP
jgi:hypothetical protein